MRHLLHLFDLSADELRDLLAQAARLKSARKQGVPSRTPTGMPEDRARITDAAPLVGWCDR